MKRDYIFYVYILSNPNRTTLYIGFTSNLERRLKEHYSNKNTNNSFAGKYHCYELVYYESYKYVTDAIAREKQLKKWRRKKKDDLIKRINPSLVTLNGNFYTEE